MSTEATIDQLICGLACAALPVVTYAHETLVDVGGGFFFAITLPQLVACSEPCLWKGCPSYLERTEPDFESRRSKPRSRSVFRKHPKSRQRTGS